MYVALDYDSIQSIRRNILFSPVMCLLAMMSMFLQDFCVRNNLKVQWQNTA